MRQAIPFDVCCVYEHQQIHTIDMNFLYKLCMSIVSKKKKLITKIGNNNLYKNREQQPVQSLVTDSSCLIQDTHSLNTNTKTQKKL